VSLRRPPGAFQVLLRRLEKNASLDPEAGARLLDERLRKRLREVVRHVPAYRDWGEDPRFRAALKRSGREALALLPITRRADVAANPEAYLDQRTPASLLRWAHTSGSSGEPLALRRDLRSIVVEEAFVVRHRRRFGYAAGDIVLRIRKDGPSLDDPEVIDYDPGSGEYRAAAAGLDGRGTGRILDALHKLKVRWLRGYPSALLELVDRAHQLGRESELRAPMLRGLFTSSETLRPAARLRLSQAFGVQIADHYGQAERALAIQDCPAGARHLLADYSAAEVVDGRWVGTPLFGRGTVLLRYDTGDGAGPAPTSLDPCPCGWTFPRVGPVEGRDDDLIITPDGRRVGRLSSAVARIEGALQVQIQQRSVDSLEVRVRPLPGADRDALIASTTSALRALLQAPGLRIRVEIGGRFVLDPSGKVRPVIGLPR
jgi:phenylacetate-CoA ligase